jgi:hypothetical protein
LCDNGFMPSVKSGIKILKSSGEKELFDPEKLIRSLRRAKATEELALAIVRDIEAELHDGMSTKEIYKHAFSMLSREQRPVAVKYSLRRAIMDLGPSGFPFEKFVAEIFLAKGYKVATNIELMGECVPHEIDVVAWNENKLIIVEAKFHNMLGIKSDIKVVLYIKARFDDMQNIYFDYGHKRKIDESWLVTNTKFSTQAIHFAECKEMRLVGWNYPADGSLQDMVEHAGLHPITCLQSISKNEEQILLQSGIVLCKSILDDPNLAINAGLHPEKVNNMIKEITEIYN